MKLISSSFLFALIIIILISQINSKPSLKCLAYLVQLKTIYQTNKGLFFQQIAPYMLFSGKQLDDMGFPKMCIDKNLTYTTVKINANVVDLNSHYEKDFLFSFYYGLCFSNLCSFQDLQTQGKFIIDKIFEDQNIKMDSIQFYGVDLQLQFSAPAFIVCILIIIWALIGMTGPFYKWIRQCASSHSHQHQVQIQIPLQQQKKKILQKQGQQYQQPIRNEFLKLISIGRKWHQLWKEQDSNKIKQFSMFKIVSIPFILYGYYFYLCNHGSFNIFSFNSQIYKAFYSNIATFSYYIPDIFFFISGYLFTKKIFTQVQFASNKYLFLLKSFGTKMLRLYPIYIVTLLIYSVITPALHSGPMWMIHKQDVEVCQSFWWRNILMIDNFFTQGCFDFSWWVQAEIQFTLLAVGTFALLLANKFIGSILLYIQLLVSWILLFTINEKLPVSIQTTMSNATLHYFKSFHSHLPFYLTGVLLALIFKKQSARRLVIKFYFKNTILLFLGLIIAFASFLMILIRPFTFQYDLLGFQLSLCRFGILFSFIIYSLPGFVKQRVNRTSIHKLATMTYPIILVSGIIVGASYWGLQTFPYTSGQTLLYNLFPNLCLSIIIGVVIHLLFNFRPYKNQNSKVI